MLRVSVERPDRVRERRDREEARVYSGGYIGGCHYIGLMYCCCLSVWGGAELESEVVDGQVRLSLLLNECRIELLPLVTVLPCNYETM